EPTEVDQPPATGILQTTRGMKAVRFENPNGEIRIGRLEDDETTITDAGPAGPRGFVPTPEGWQTIESASGPTYNTADVQLRHPVVPSKILAIGLNYRGHAEEIGAKIPDVPVVFAIWSSSLIGDKQPIVLPREETKPDYEAELALVIGQRTYRADKTNRRDLGVQRRLGPAGPAGNPTEAVHAR